MPIDLSRIQYLIKHPAIALTRHAYARYRYRAPLFTLRETLNAFQQHNSLSVSASLSFYALFALIPLALLIFFLLSHLVVSSDYAIVKLAIITSDLVPKFSQYIMLEVYNLSRHQAVWGAFGLFALFWVVTPLAGALRSAFYTIAATPDTASYIQRKLGDAFTVTGILMMFCLFTIWGLVVQKFTDLLQSWAVSITWLSSASSLAVITLLLTLFYRIFFPTKVTYIYLFIGSFVIAVLWLIMRPLFGLFLTYNQTYGFIFGNMKNLFISIGWLYYTFVVFC